MKYYKYEGNIYKQPNNIIPSFATEITEEEYYQLVAEFEEHQTQLAQYVSDVRSGVITLDDVPAEYYDEVYAIINAPVPEEPDPDQEFIDRLISEVNANE